MSIRPTLTLLLLTTVVPELLTGSTPLRGFLSVTLPLSVQGIAAGSVIVFCLTVGAFITPLWLGRGHVTVMAIAIHEQMVTLVDWPGGAASAMLLTFSTLLLLAGYGLLLRRWATDGRLVMSGSDASAGALAEQHIPRLPVVLHGVFAGVTLVLVLLVAFRG